MYTLEGFTARVIDFSTSSCHDWRNRLLLVFELGCPARWTAHVSMTYKRTPHPHNHSTTCPRSSRLFLLVLLSKEVPVVVLVHSGSTASGFEFAHLMKSASSELEALMGGVAVAVGLAELPDMAYVTPPNMVANQPIASYMKYSGQFLVNAESAAAGAIGGQRTYWPATCLPAIV